MKMIEYLYYGMLVIALVLIYFAVKQYSSSADLMENGIKTKAEVIELIEVYDNDGSTYTPVFEFTDRAQTKITFKSEVSSSPAPYKVGDKVAIVYASDTEERRVVSFWGLYRWTMILLCIAAPLLIIGGGYLLYARG